MTWPAILTQPPWRWTWFAMGLAVAERLGAYVFLSFRPIAFDVYVAAERRPHFLWPLDVVGIDIEHYMGEAEKMASGAWLAQLFEISAIPDVTPPLVPFLLWQLDYGPGHAIPASLLWLLMSCAWACGWIWLLSRRNLSGPWLCVFALVPTPLLYQFAVGTDLPSPSCFSASTWPI